MARDYYGILGVQKDSSDQELKRAYRKLARELHPDINPDEAAQARFREVTTAYEVLTDPDGDQEIRDREATFRRGGAVKPWQGDGQSTLRPAAADAGDHHQESSREPPVPGRR